MSLSEVEKFWCVQFWGILLDVFLHRFKITNIERRKWLGVALLLFTCLKDDFCGTKTVVKTMTGSIFSLKKAEDRV